MLRRRKLWILADGGNVTFDTSQCLGDRDKSIGDPSLISKASTENIVSNTFYPIKSSKCRKIAVSSPGSAIELAAEVTWVQAGHRGVYCWDWGPKLFDICHPYFIHHTSLTAARPDWLHYHLKWINSNFTLSWVLNPSLTLMNEQIYLH